MSKTAYDTIGKDYNQNRRADGRLVDRIAGLLDLPAGAVIADIGAGTGNYAAALADRGYRVMAVEPSAAMRAQAAPHDNFTWISGSAEAVPLPDASVDGVVVILAIHHFTSVGDAARELMRICAGGPIVVFTTDPRLAEPEWFADYFPEIQEWDFGKFPPIAEFAGALAETLGRPATVHPFPLPHDFTDRNMRTGWNRPEGYLDEQVRRNTSGFALADAETVKTRIATLKRDLRSGAWDRKYGHLRTQPEFDAGFRLVKFSGPGEGGL